MRFCKKNQKEPIGYFIVLGEMVGIVFFKDIYSPVKFLSKANFDKKYEVFNG